MPGRAEFPVLMGDKLRVFLDEDFAGRAEIKFFGFVPEKFAVNAGPDQAPVSIDVHLGHSQFGRGQVFLFIHATSGRIEFATGGVDALDLGFRHAR